MSGLFFEDFNEGDEFVTPRRTITEADVMAFAGLAGDHNPLHTDAVFAAQTPFGERIAHGLLILGIASGLVSRLGVFDGTALALLGIEDWRFIAPVKFGDTIHVQMRIIEKRETSHPERGILRRALEIVNQRGDIVQAGTLALMCRRRRDNPRS